jgi:uncharacterized protein with PQ loop repeat
MDLIELAGYIGALFLISAWVYEAYKTYRKGDRPDIKFIAAYTVGLSFLAWHSYKINDTPFLLLNSTILVLTLIELDLVLRKKSAKAVAPS